MLEYLLEDESQGILKFICIVLTTFTIKMRYVLSAFKIRSEWLCLKMYLLLKLLLAYFSHSQNQNECSN